MLPVIYHEAATNVTPELLSLPVTLSGLDRYLSSMESSTSRFTPVRPVKIATSSWCALLLSDLIVTPCHSLCCDQRN